MTTKNIILSVDSYKTSHYKAYPEDTTMIASYIEARKNNSPYNINEVVFLGTEMFMDSYLNPITKYDIDEAEDTITKHGLPFNREGWEHILNEWGGMPPLAIRALPEGSLVPFGVPQVEVWNTDEKCFWLTSYIETALLRAIWYPSSVATISNYCKRIIYHFLKQTSDDPAGQILFKLHDFGARGAASAEAAAIGGVAHLVNFRGTDTIEALSLARETYSCGMAGFSIPAAEHSTVTAWGREGEIAAYENMLDKFSSPGHMVAVVSDSYDLFNAIANIWGGTLKKKLIETGGTLVIRPDSGNPIEVLKKVFDILESKFDITLNQKGFKLLPNYIRVIQGDGVNPDSIYNILNVLTNMGWSTDNIAFGMGGALLQNVNRDTFGYAMKASVKQGTETGAIGISKNPITDAGKKSKEGYHFVNLDNKIYTSDMEETTLKETSNKDGLFNSLEYRFYFSESSRTTFDAIRRRADSWMTD